MSLGWLVVVIVVLALFEALVVFGVLAMRRRRDEENIRLFVSRGYRTVGKKDPAYRQLLREVSDALGINIGFPYFGLLAELGDGAYFFEYILPSRYSVWVYYGLLQRSVVELEPLPDFKVGKRGFLAKLLRSGARGSFEDEFSVEPSELLNLIPDPYGFTEFVRTHDKLQITKDGGRLVLTEKRDRRLPPEEVFQKAQEMIQLKDRLLSLLS